MEHRLIGRAIVEIEADCNLSPFGELDRIANQVREHLLQARGVGDRVIGHAFLNVVDEFKSFAARAGGQRLQTGRQPLAHAKRHRFDRQPPGLDF